MRPIIGPRGANPVVTADKPPVTTDNPRLAEAASNGRFCGTEHGWGIDPATIALAGYVAINGKA